MRRSSSALEADPESLTRRVRSRRYNEVSSTSASSSQLLTQDARPAPPEANHPSGFFAGASNVNANNGMFNDVARDQYYIKVDMQDYGISTPIGPQAVHTDLPVNVDRSLLDKLPSVKHAGYQSVDHEPCLTGTRREELRRIEEWEADYTDKRIYWLNGLAGYGKSTIARTFAERSSEKGKLGASFFCSRDFEDRRNIRFIFPTLARELAYRYTEFKTALIPIIESNPNIGHTLPSTQLESLLVRPLKSIGLYTTIIIDALDECKEDQPASVILSLLGKHIDEIPFVKFFITGRPEPPIRSGFRLPLLRPHAEVFLLHDVDRESVDQDIELYVKTCLSEIVTWTNYDLPVPWPTEKETLAIVNKSSGHFIVSSIIVRFIASRFHDPQERMKMIICNPESTVLEGKSGIDATYRQVFLQSCENVDIDDSDVFERLRLVIGSIILVFNPLSRMNLEVILGISLGDIRNAAYIFHSVLIVPESDSEPMRVCHKSLADFATDAKRCTDSRFYIDSSVYHMKLGMSCLKVMNEKLKRNICDLPPYAMNKDINDLDQRREKYIGGGLEYACRSWTKHLRFVSCHGEHVGDVVKSLECFFNHKLLSWLEVLSIIGDLGSAVYSLRDIRRWFVEVGYPDTSLLALVKDSERFVLRFFDAISASAPHIYDSGLLLCPRTCQVRARYHDQMQTKVKVFNAIDDSWDACSRTIKTQGSVRSIAFSHKDDLIAVGGYGHVAEIFEAATGQRRAIFTLTTSGPAGCSSLAFSPDNRILVNGCDDGIIYVWDLQTGDLASTLEGHTSSISSVALSPCGNIIASGSTDHDIRIWSVSTYECLCTLVGHSDEVESICWLGTGEGITRLVSSSCDRSVRLWDVVGARCLKTFTEFNIWVIGHSRHSSRLFACGAWRTIWVIDAWTRDVFQTISINGFVTSIRLLNEDKVMYTTESTFFIHDLTNNSNLLTFDYEGSRPAISSDGSCIVSDSGSFVKVLQTSNTSQNQDVARYDEEVQCVAFSGDGQLIASASSDVVKVWEATSGRCLDTFSTNDNVDSLAFSTTTLLAVKTSRCIRIWNIRCRALVSTIIPTGGAIRSKFSPDHSQLVSLSFLESNIQVYKTHLELWEIATGDCLASVKLNSDDFDRVTFDSDGTSVIVDSIFTQNRERWSISPRTRDLSTDNNHNDDHSPPPMMFVPVHDTQQPTSPDVPSQQVYYEDMDEWILDNQERRMCWALPDMRGSKYDVHGGKVVIGCGNGRVVIVDISDVR